MRLRVSSLIVFLMEAFLRKKYTRGIMYIETQLSHSKDTGGPNTVLAKFDDLDFAALWLYRSLRKNKVFPNGLQEENL